MKTPHTIARGPWSSLPPITVEIECSATTPEGVRLGLALRVAVSHRADLSDAVLSDANLSGADLGGLIVAGRAIRSDGHEFFAWTSVLGGHAIRAGCRTFTLDQFRDHVAREYPDTAKGEETLAILAFLESRLRIAHPAAVV